MNSRADNLSPVAASPVTSIRTFIDQQTISVTSFMVLKNGTGDGLRKSMVFPAGEPQSPCWPFLTGKVHDTRSILHDEVDPIPLDTVVRLSKSDLSRDFRSS